MIGEDPYDVCSGQIVQRSFSQAGYTLSYRELQAASRSPTVRGSQTRIPSRERLAFQGDMTASCTASHREPISGIREFGGTGLGGDCDAAIACATLGNAG